MKANRLLIVGAFIGMALLLAPVAALGQGKTQVCGVDVVLMDPIGFIDPQYLVSLDPLILQFNADLSDNFVTVYDVRGVGTYDRYFSNDGGRLLIVGGRWSSVITDPNRFIDVRAVNGPLRGHTLRMNIVQVIDGGISVSSWTDQQNPSLVGRLFGGTDC